jgi:hypothetical protein
MNHKNNKKIYTEEELHNHNHKKKFKPIDSCMTSFINWFLRLCNIQKKDKNEPNKIIIK